MVGTLRRSAGLSTDFTESIDFSIMFHVEHLSSGRLVFSRLDQSIAIALLSAFWSNPGVCDVPRGTIRMMMILSESRIEELLALYLHPVPQTLLVQLSRYLDLLVRWNTRTNLTAVRSPEEMVRRHFGESLFAAKNLGDPLPENLLDLGSGAGFPGLPIALFHPQIKVTLAESQNKKATFLREVIRHLQLHNVEVWGGRAEALPEDRLFHTVTLRAVDETAAALKVAESRALRQILLLTTEEPELPANFFTGQRLSLPESRTGILLRALRN
jgi:16S rRNA (guanine527-N7)-methyltransferase